MVTVSLRGTKRLVLGVQGHWNPELNVTITTAMLRPGSDGKHLVLSLPPAAQDPSAPCWQRLEGSRRRGETCSCSSITQQRMVPTLDRPHPSLPTASGQ